jgi:hypothetical protein
MIANNDNRAFKLNDIEAALRRAALRARRIAAQTGTPLVIMENGKIVELDVTHEAQESQQQQ